MSKLESQIDKEELRNRQLFTVLRDVPLVDYPSYDNDSGLYETPTTDIKPALVLMQWPGGQPCTEMDLYLLWLAKNHAKLDRNGGSVRTEAAKLSHLVRFCHKRQLNFWDMWSEQFNDFLVELKNELKKNGYKRRDANRVIEISDSCVRFFIWLQDKLLPHRSIVNVEGKPHQILLRLKTTRDERGRKYTSLHFASNPERSTRQIKTPMPKESIDALFNAIAKKYDIANCHPSFAARFPNEEALNQYLTFQMETWRSLLTVCLALGCRPSEVTNMNRTRSMAALDEEKRLILATMKREDGAERKVPVTMNIVISLKLYDRKYRARMLEQLRSEGNNPDPNDILFLNSDGNPLTKETLTRQFERLCRYAGINFRTCLSMFRHRAITSLVAIHLKEFCVGRLDIAMQALTDADYSTILAKVAAITGHKNPESLRAYIDLAWEELGAFDTVNAAAAISAIMQTFTHDLAFGRHRLERASIKEKADAFDDFLTMIRKYEEEMRECLEAYRYVKGSERALIP